MPRRLHFILFLLISFGLHVLVFAVVFFVSKAAEERTPLPTPVQIVNLPSETLKKLPPIKQGIPARTIPRPITPRDKKTEVLRLPQTAPTAKPSDKREGPGAPSTEAVPRAKKGGPLPFLSQQDINELARKGYPDDKLRNDVLSQDTEAFKFLPYGRSLFGKLNRNMRFPKLAAISGLQGDVFIDFVINKDGSLGTIEIEKSSGYKILDDEVVRLIQDSAPFQPLPPEWNVDRIIIPVIGMFRIYYGEIR